MIDIFKKNKIIPVIFSILYVADDYPDYYSVNKEVKEANSLIKQTCKESNVNFIDLNNLLGNNKILKKEYSFDGIHLTALAYKKWGKIVDETIKKYID